MRMKLAVRFRMSLSIVRLESLMALATDMLTIDTSTPAEGRGTPRNSRMCLQIEREREKERGGGGDKGGGGGGGGGGGEHARAVCVCVCVCARITHM